MLELNQCNIQEINYLEIAQYFGVFKNRMGNISLGKNNIEFRSVDQALDIIKNAMSNEKEIWISGDNVYPSMAICLNGKYAAITYFQSEDGVMWLSYNENNQKVVTFLAGGEEWIPEPNAVIGINDMLSCVKEFLNSYERPTCICWQDL